eukprot:Tamp_08005.p2 GENE.Tamp_08005~~Tamp_08005.p2  ORF type:complete len:249 (+),score=59.21 Tamp_08005:741-1487(+)
MELGVPVAHSPGNQVASTPDANVSPKTAAEELGFTFLPCVLANLHRAPALVPPHDPRAARAIWARDVDALVVPANAADGAAALALALEGRCLVIAVDENDTVNKGTPAALGMRHVTAGNYPEAIGLLAAHKAGVLPAAMTSYMAPIPPLAETPAEAADRVIDEAGGVIDEGQADEAAESQESQEAAETEEPVRDSAVLTSPMEPDTSVEALVEKELEDAVEKKEKEEKKKKEVEEKEKEDKEKKEKEK